VGGREAGEAGTGGGEGAREGEETAGGGGGEKDADTTGDDDANGLGENARIMMGGELDDSSGGDRAG